MIPTSVEFEKIFRCAACGKTHKGTVTNHYKQIGYFVEEPEGRLIKYPLSYNCPVNGKEQVLEIDVLTSDQKKFEYAELRGVVLYGNK
jgi:transcription elongation factor Elf1